MKVIIWFIFDENDIILSQNAQKINIMFSESELEQLNFY